MQDRNFNDIAARFNQTIYASARGRLRLRALECDFRDLTIPIQGAQVLDIGGGQGQFSLHLAKQGAHIALCDHAQEMLDFAVDYFAQEQQNLQAQCCTLQEVQRYFPQQFDVVLNHAVLEWLEDPLAALPILASKVKTGGWLSLMFYNLHGHVWRQLMNGGLDNPLGSNPKLRQEGNAPQHPLDPEIIEQALLELGFEVKRWRGIRAVHDHMPQKLRERVGEEALTQADLEYGLKDPYKKLGRYVHFLAVKA